MKLLSRNVLYKLLTSIPSKRFFNPALGQRWKSRFAYPVGMKAYEEDYVEEAQYPSIDYETRHFAGSDVKKLEGIMRWRQSIQQKETVEEKLMQLNYNRRYGWKSYILGDENFHYDALDLIKYITRTTDPKMSMELPDLYLSEELISKVKQYFDLLKKPLEEVIEFEIHGVRRTRSDYESESQFSLAFNQSLVNQVTRVILQVLSAHEPALKEIQVDYGARIEAFWMIGGFYPQQGKFKLFEEFRKSGKDENWIEQERRRDLSFQYVGSPIVQIRSKIPMQQVGTIGNIQDSSNPSFFEFQFSPNNYGYSKKLRHATNIPGHWSGDPANSNWLSFHSSHFLLPGQLDGTPQEYMQAKQEAFTARSSDLLQSQAVINSFSKLVAQAYMLGFDQFTDIGYPLSSQAVLCNELEWSFHAYQLNTIRLDKHNLKKNLKTNFSWTSPAIRIISETGELNPLFLELLLKFYLAPTLSTQKKFETPYIKCNLQDIADDFKREFILYNFQEMYSLRRTDVFAHQLPEIYAWEQIYKIQHKSRPQEPPKKFFEIGWNPYFDKYCFKNPRYRPKRLKFLEAELEAKKELARVEEIKENLAQRYKTKEPNS